MTGTSIKTNGIGKRCTSHLNLTRSMADVDRDRAAYPAAQLEAARARTYERISDAKIPYAGSDRS